MDKRRIELIIVAVLILVFIILSANTFSRFKKPELLIAPQPVQSVTKKAESIASKLKDAQGRPGKRDLTWGRDPFRLARTKDLSSSHDLALNGIIWDEDNPYAIINGEVVISGDYINGNMVVYIGKNSVILDSGTEQFELKVWE
jgi:hypothetical protein